MKKFFATICAALLISGCNETPTPSKPAQDRINLDAAKDGIYIVESSRDVELGNGTLTLTIRDKKIVAAEFTGYDVFGKVKDADYGSLAGKDSDDYRKAQAAVDAIKIYPAQLVATQDLSAVDAIAGATVSYNQFVETVKRAATEASK